MNVDTRLSRMPKDRTSLTHVKMPEEIQIVSEGGYDVKAPAVLGARSILIDKLSYSAYFLQDFTTFHGRWNEAAPAVCNSEGGPGDQAKS